MSRFWVAWACVALVPLTGCEEDLIGEADPVYEVEPLHLDFGTKELGQQAILPIKIRNLESVDGKLEGIEILDNCGGCFLNTNEVTDVEGLATVELNMRFRAVRLEVATGTLTISTDDPDLKKVAVTMIGRGSDLRRPDIAVSPEAVRFGFVPAGGIALSSFLVRSTGTNNLIIDRVRLEPPGAPFSITTSTRSVEMPPGDSKSLTLKAELPEVATATTEASLIFETNVPEVKNVPGKVGWLEVPISATANRPPLAVVGPDQVLEPWTRARLDGSMSHDQDTPQDLPLSYRWAFRSMPPGSTTYVELATSPTPSFWVDLTGRYEIELVVIDALGLESLAAVTVVEALPTNVVRFELVWDHPDADLDLHLIREGGDYCSCDSDVHYRDCGRTPNWFPATPGANPRLDVDDRSGFGPENINIDGDGPERFIPEGIYTFGVHYYSSNAGVSRWPTRDTTATIRVYVYGLLAAEFSREMVENFCPPPGDNPALARVCTRSMLACFADTDCQIAGQFWFAGELDWPSGVIRGLSHIEPNAICSIF